MKIRQKITYVDDDTESIGMLFRLRMPSLVVGLVLGVGISFVTSNFEEVISRHVEIAFFLPFIVYMAAAIGTQTETVFSRDLKSGRVGFQHYLVKETLLGIAFGLIFGALTWVVVMVWLHNAILAISIGLSMLLAVAFAPIIALLTTEALNLLHEDPAAWAGPLATVLQDMVSILLYGTITSALLL